MHTIRNAYQNNIMINSGTFNYDKGCTTEVIRLEVTNSNK